MCISTYQLSDRPGRKLMKVVAQVRILYDQPPPTLTISPPVKFRRMKKI